MEHAALARKLDDLEPVAFQRRGPPAPLRQSDEPQPAGAGNGLDIVERDRIPPGRDAIAAGDKRAIDQSERKPRSLEDFLKTRRSHHRELIPPLQPEIDPVGRFQRLELGAVEVQDIDQVQTPDGRIPAHRALETEDEETHQDGAHGDGHVSPPSGRRYMMYGETYEDRGPGSRLASGSARIVKSVRGLGGSFPP